MPPECQLHPGHYVYRGHPCPQCAADASARAAAAPLGALEGLLRRMQDYTALVREGRYISPAQHDADQAALAAAVATVHGLHAELLTLPSEPPAFDGTNATHYPGERYPGECVAFVRRLRAAASRLASAGLAAAPTGAPRNAGGRDA